MSLKPFFVYILYILAKMWTEIATNPLKTFQDTDTDVDQHQKSITSNFSLNSPPLKPEQSR